MPATRHIDEAPWQRVARTTIRLAAAGCAGAGLVWLAAVSADVLQHTYIQTTRGSPDLRPPLPKTVAEQAMLRDWSHPIAWLIGAGLLWLLQRALSRYISRPPSRQPAARGPAAISAALRIGVLACAACAFALLALAVVRAVEHALTGDYFRRPPPQQWSFTSQFLHRLLSRDHEPATAWAVGAFALWLIERQLPRLLMPLSPGRCPNCAYDLGKTPPDHCPECGSPTTPKPPTE